MTETSSRLYCEECGEEFSVDYRGSCTACGNPRLTRVQTVQQSVEIRETVGGESRREYLQEKPQIKRLLWAISVGAPFLGLVLAGWAGVWVGLGLAILTQLLGPKAAMKVREIRKL